MDLLKLFSLLGLFLYFGVLLLVVWKEKKNKNVLDYFFAGRNLSYWALSLTFIASWWGAGSAISTADLAFEDGLGAFWYYGVPVLISTFLLILFSKNIRRINYLTQGQMMKARYSKAVSRMLSFFVFLFMTITAASQMVGIGDFFGTYLELPYIYAVLLGTSIVVIYSLFGGFRGVVLTDIVQFILLLISAVIVFVVAYSASGGWDAIIEQAQIQNKPEYTSFFAGAEKYFVYVLTFGCAWMIQANVWQRISAARNVVDAKRMATMSFFAYIPLYLIVVLTGMCGVVLYKDLPAGGLISGIILDYMHPIMGALVFVGIAAAIMSTMDSLINTAAMTLSLDLNPFKGNEEKQLQISRVATILVVCIALLIALKIRSILTISWIASDIITTGVFVPLLGGFLWRRATSQAALASMIVGAIYCGYNLFLFMGVDLPHCWELESTSQILIGLALSISVFVSVSLCTKPDFIKADSFLAKASGKEV